MEKKKEPLRCRSVAEADSTSWREVAGLNEITDVGSYIVQLKHAAVNNELPLPACDNEHYIVATLIVTESGSAEKLQKHRVIGQTLILSQCNDGQTGIYYRSQAPVDGEQVWSEWNALLSTGQFNEIADGNTSITLDVKDNSVTAQKLSADVRKKVDSPLRPLYIAAGAEYNDSGADKTKTAPWGETITHKAGHYYLNGLGDITEEHMMDIYVMTYPYYTTSDLTKAFRVQGGQTEVTTRTNFRHVNYFTGVGEKSTLSMESICYGNTIIEVLAINHSSNVITVSGIFNGFISSSRLKSIIGNLSISQTTAIDMSHCSCLVNFTFHGLKSNINFKRSSNISKASILYLISNAQPSSTVTVTLHPSAYARLADDADIVSALEAQPLISLVSA